MIKQFNSKLNQWLEKSGFNQVLFLFVPLILMIKISFFIWPDPSSAITNSYSSYLSGQEQLQYFDQSEVQKVQKIYGNPKEPVLKYAPYTEEEQILYDRNWLIRCIILLVTCGALYGKYIWWLFTYYL